MIQYKQRTMMQPNARLKVLAMGKPEHQNMLCNLPLAPGKAGLSLSLEQHRVDFHSMSAADYPSENDWKGQSLPAVEREEKRT